MNTIQDARHVPIQDPPGLEPAKKSRHAELVDAAAKFERIFAQMMVKGMRESGKVAGGQGLFGEGPGSDTYTDWFDGLMSDRLVSNQGLGMQKTLIKEWERSARAAEIETKPEVNHDVA